jgi:hypothetical protein
MTQPQPLTEVEWQELRVLESLLAQRRAYRREAHQALGLDEYMPYG